MSKQICSGTCPAIVPDKGKIMASFAGALKDQLDDDTQPHDAPRRVPLQAAIFEHPDFERLEAEGRAGDDDEKIREAPRKIRDELK